MSNYRKERADQLQELVSKLPRLGTRPIEDHDHLRGAVYEIAIDLAYQREVLEKAGDRRWTNMADLLDDVLDLADYVTAMAK